MPASPYGSKRPQKVKPRTQTVYTLGDPDTPRYRGKLRTRTTAQNDRATTNAVTAKAGVQARKRGQKTRSDYGPGSPYQLRTRTIAENKGANTPKVTGPKPKVKKPAKPSTKPSTTAPSVGSGSGSTPVAGGGTIGGPAKVGRPKGKSPGERNRSVQNTSEGRSTGGAAADKQVQDPISTLFSAARRQLDEENQRMDAIRRQRVADMAKFDDYMRQARERGNSTLQQQYAASANDAQAARAAGDQRINDLINQAKALAGGNPDVARASGMTANEASFGFQQQGDAVRSAANAFNQANLTTRNVDREKEDIARSGDLRQNIESRYDAFLRDLGKQRGQLGIDEAKARIEQSNADRNFQIEREAADFLQKIKMGQLGVDQTNAKTAQIKAISQANFNNEMLKLRRAVEQGKLTMAQANLQAKQRIASANLSEKQKDRLQRLRIAKLRSAPNAGNVAKGAQANVQKFINESLSTTYGGKKFTDIDDHGKSNIVRGSIVRLATENPGLNARQAWTILNSVLGGRLMESNPQYLALVNRNFKR